METWLFVPVLRFGGTLGMETHVFVPDYRLAGCLGTECGVFVPVYFWMERSRISNVMSI